MKFLNLKILNFKPYFCEDGNPQLLNLYDKKRKDRNITLIVGQNESGKTSISEAIMWCIFGASYWPKWSEWVNDISMELTKIEEEKKVKIGIEIQCQKNTCKRDSAHKRTCWFVSHCLALFSVVPATARPKPLPQPDF